MLAFAEYGHGSPVVLLHGLLGSKINLVGIGRTLAGRFHTYIVDMRNHGESFHHGSMTYKTMAADLGGFLDDHDIDKAAIVGHSMGGKCAMQFALSFPERVDKLAVIDIAPRQYQNPLWAGYLKAMLSLKIAELGSRKEADQILAAAIPDTVYRQFLLSNLVSGQGSGFEWKPNLEAILEAAPHICAAVSGPANSLQTLFIKGGNSTYIEDIDKDLIRELFPNSRFVTVPGVGHLVHIEARDQLQQILCDFLEKDGKA